MTCVYIGFMNEDFIWNYVMSLRADMIPQED